MKNNVSAIEIKNCKGFVLRGFLHLPESASEIVVMLHGFTGNKTEHAGHFRNLSRRLEKIGIASMRMDYHGNGESDGEFFDFVFEDALDDALRMVEYAKSIDGIKKVHLLGFSMGGAIASLVANENIDKLILWSPAGSMNNISNRVLVSWRTLENGNYYVPGFEMSKKFIESINKFSMYQNCANIKNETIIIQGTKDLSVLPEFSYKYSQEIKGSVLHYIDGAGHGYDSYEQREELYSLTIEFINRK